MLGVHYIFRRRLRVQPPPGTEPGQFCRRAMLLVLGLALALAKASTTRVGLGLGVRTFLPISQHRWGQNYSNPIQIA